VHRDLEPENVLRAGTRWKLADFGIAKNRARAAPGVTFKQAGTYGYAAPEQLEGSPADPSADIYSFGKVLTYLATARPIRTASPRRRLDR
jgi:serine/threonine-protein kinase